METNLTLALILAIIVMFYLTLKLVKSMFYKVKRNIFSGYGALKMLGLTGVVSTANFQLVNQAIHHFWK
jgi:hypothetical protein